MGGEVGSELNGEVDGVVEGPLVVGILLGALVKGEVDGCSEGSSNVGILDGILAVGFLLGSAALGTMVGFSVISHISQVFGQLSLINCSSHANPLEALKATSQVLPPLKSSLPSAAPSTSHFDKSFEQQLHFPHE